MGLVFDRINLSVNKTGNEDEEYFNLYGFGNGAHLVYTYRINSRNSVFIDVLTATPTVTANAAKETNSKEITLGARQNIFLGTVTSITEQMIKLKVGLEQGTQALTVDGVAQEDTQLSTIIALHFDFYF